MSLAVSTRSGCTDGCVVGTANALFGREETTCFTTFCICQMRN